MWCTPTPPGVSVLAVALQGKTMEHSSENMVAYKQCCPAAGSLRIALHAVTVSQESVLLLACDSNNLHRFLNGRALH